MEAGQTTPRKPVWSIVRHYIVLFSSDNDKKDTNRVWHDGRLKHHTYNGRLFLCDESGNVEVANGFHSQRDPSALFADGHELTLDDFVVQIQGFERVSRTDVAPILHATEEAAKRKRQERARQARSEALSGGEGSGWIAAARSPVTPSVNREQAMRSRVLASVEIDRQAAVTPRRPQSGSTEDGTTPLPAFRTPFKRPSSKIGSPARSTLAQDSTSESDIESRQLDRPIKKRLGPARARQSLGRSDSSG